MLTRFCTSLSDEMSVGMNSTFSPNPLAILSPFDVDKSATITFAPFFTNRLTVPSPRPDAPPVTRVTRFFARDSDKIVYSLEDYFRINTEIFFSP